MKCTILCGPANSGKVRALLDQFRAAAAGGGAWLVEPTQGDVQRTMRELTQGGTFLGGTIGSFNALIGDLSGTTRDAVAENAALRVVVRRVVNRDAACSELRHYPGFAQTAFRIVTELRGAHVAGETAFEAAVSRVPFPTRRLWLGLLDKVNREVGELGIIDDAAFAQLALEAVRNQQAIVVPTFAYGFDDLSYMQRELLLAIAGQASVTITLPYVTGRHVFERRTELVSDFEQRGAIIVESGSAAFANAELLTVEQRLYEPALDQLTEVEHTGAISTIECSGSLQEAEETVREVARALALGVPAHDIACIAVNPQQLRPLLEPVFAQYGIPVHFEMPRDIFSVPAGRALRDAIVAAGGNDPVARQSFLNSRVAPAQSSLLLDEFAGLLATVGSAAESVQAVRRFVHALRPHVLARTSADTQLDERAQRELHGDLRLLNAVSDVMQHAERHLSAAALTRREILDLLASVPIAVPDARNADAVVVAPINRVRTERFHTVILFGLDATSAAAPASEPDGAAVIREQMYIAVTRPSERLIAIRQAADSAGSLVAASPAWLELCRLVPHTPRRARSLDETVIPLPSVVAVNEVLPALCAAAGDGLPAADLAAQILSPTLQAALPPRDVVGTTPAEPATYVGDAFLAAFAETPTVRITDVETYMHCSARWFIDRHLLPKVSDETPSQRMGIFLHAVLADCIPQIAADSKPDTTDRRMSILTESIQRVAEATERSLLPTLMEQEHVKILLRPFVASEQFNTRDIRTEVPISATRVGAFTPFEIGGKQLVGIVDRIDVSGDGVAILHDYKKGGDGTTAANLLKEGRVQLLLYLHSLRETSQLMPAAMLYRHIQKGKTRGVINKDLVADPNALAKLVKHDVMDTIAVDEIVMGAVQVAEQSITGMSAGAVKADPLDGTCVQWCTFHQICRVGDT